MEGNTQQRSTAKSLSEELEEALTVAVRRTDHRVTDKTLGNAIADLSLSVFDRVGEDEVVARVKTRISEQDFSPFNVIRSMDVKGNLNQSNIKQLRSLETKGVRYKRGTILPSTHAITMCMKKIEKLADDCVSFEIIHTEQGERIRFDFAKMLDTLIKAYGLEAIGRVRSIRLAQTFDGAQLTRHWSHVMGGIKMHDRGAFCPLRRLPLYSGDFVSHQLRNWCFPMQINIGREGEQMTEYFRPMFDFCSSLAVDGFNDMLPFILATEIDMSATWKGLCRGGGAKVANYPCHCCAIHSNDLAVPNECNCGRWYTAHSDLDFKCYHHPIVTDELLASMQDEVRELEVALSKAAASTSTSQLTREDPTSNQGRKNAQFNPNSIWFHPTNTTKIHAVLSADQL